MQNPNDLFGGKIAFRLKSGIVFDLENPHPDQILIEDIAHCLSGLPRFGAHTDPYYYVAQHCVLAAREAPDHLKFAALMHDAAETYIGDIKSPTKRLFREDIEDIELEIDYAIASAFGIKNQHDPLIKEIDMRMFHTENRDLNGVDSPDAYDFEIVPWDSESCKAMFMQSFYAWKDLR